MKLRELSINWVIGSVEVYDGEITELEDNQIAVVTTNTEGRHGKGFALTCRLKFGAIYGVPRGLQGRCFGIVTKDLTKKVHPSRTRSQIEQEIAGLYMAARLDEEKKFLVPYRAQMNNLNAYTPEQLSEMFASFPIPQNIIFESTFAPLVFKARFNNYI